MGNRSVSTTLNAQRKYTNRVLSVAETPSKLPKHLKTTYITTKKSTKNSSVVSYKINKLMSYFYCIKLSIAKR